MGVWEVCVCACVCEHALIYFRKKKVVLERKENYENDQNVRTKVREYVRALQVHRLAVECHRQGRKKTAIRKGRWGQ